MAAPAKKKLKVNDDLTLTLPAKMPFEVVRYIDNKTGEMDIPKVLETLLGEDQAADVWALGLDIEAGVDLVDELFSQYGTDTGK